MADNQKGVNGEHKDRLFKYIFGNPKYKQWTLSLYNAVNGSDYSDADAIKLNTLEDVVYMGMKNDVSFLIYDVMSIYEHQASFNPNMPMRMFSYGASLYEKYIEQTPSYHKYSSAQQKLPVPKCICFYNGTDKKEDRIILKLSDSFEGGVDFDIEVKVMMININYGHNKDLLEACKPLKEYAWFVNEIRQNQKKFDTLEQAIDAALTSMADDCLLKPFLLENKAEVKHMCITEYDEERTLAEQFEEGVEVGEKRGIEIGEKRGIKIGEEKGTLNLLISLVTDGILTLAEAAKRANMTVAEFECKTGLKA